MVAAMNQPQLDYGLESTYDPDPISRQTATQSAQM